MCGFLGLIHSDRAVRDIHDGLVAVQHRGQDAAGIITYDGRFHVQKGSGLVRDIFKNGGFDLLQGSIGVGHVRYPTIGSGGVEDAQPFVVNFPYGIVMAHNGNVANYRELKEELEAEDARHIDSGCDVEIVLNVFALALSHQAKVGFSTGSYYAAVNEVFKRVHGAYSVVGFIAGHGLYAFRDPYGIKPIAFGRRELDGQVSYAVASESVVLDVLGYELEPAPAAGEAILVDLEGQVHRRQVVPSQLTPCLFEFVYFARPDSMLDGISVYHTRMRMGQRLAAKIRRLGLDIDVVVPVPDSARHAAHAIANELELPYREGLVKNRYVGRTFIMPDQGSRRRSVRHKLNPIRMVFEGKRVLLVDDSIVRGNTSRKIVEMVRRCGAERVYLASTAPPLRYPCVYGIDMATRLEFIARGREPDAIGRLIGVDRLIYQDLEDLEAAAGEGNPRVKQFCNACFSGRYPTDDISESMLIEIERERLSRGAGDDRAAGDEGVDGGWPDESASRSAGHRPAGEGAVSGGGGTATRS
ncbi:MAG: amidophosphoribosyltransferase [Candidatus Eiseniibacteriota bacterium]|jgi:amidophosphoribosyltransferase